ncbi:MAG: hypothetical protein WC499_01900 [Patescibacteria group bacterium]
MELPKLVYDDFYKFLMSLGTILFVVSGIGIFISSNLALNIWPGFVIGLSLVFIINIWIMVWAGRRWYQNQKLLDKKLGAEVKLIEQEAQKTLQPTSENVADKNDSALVSYQIASVLSGTIYFDFLKDWKVWFVIQNQETKKYKAYVKIKFISGDKVEEVSEGYYGGIKAWNLNAFSQIMAPGLGIPNWVKEKAKQREKIEIRISCEVKDEADRLIEKKLPTGFVYNYGNNSWYYEP